MVKSAQEVAELICCTKRQGEQILYLTEANPFGAEDLDIAKDSVYLFRITTENADFLSVLMWVQFNPKNGDLYELPLTDAEMPKKLKYSEKMWRSLPNYCW